MIKTNNQSRVNETQHFILLDTLIDFPVTTVIALCVSVNDYNISALHVQSE